MLRGFVLGALVLIALLAFLAGVVVWGFGYGGLGSDPDAGALTERRVPGTRVAERTRRQAEPRLALELSDRKQVLFGDLHVHSTFSSDAFLFSLPVLQGEGAHPPADACDFARFCAELDFWSLTDHAELLTPLQWQETKEAIRSCNAVAGDPADPDLVSFLGWEWTQSGATPADHYGHKNVILLETGEDGVPTRPIGAGKGQLSQVLLSLPLSLRLVLPLTATRDRGHYLDFNRYLESAASLPECASGVDVAELPSGCLEYAPTPDVLFEKLAQWGERGVDSLVIPHGLAWGIHAPPGSSLDVQLRPGWHRPERQRLLEVYSGHGASEVHRAWRAVEPDGDGAPACPAPRDGHTPCCWQAGELIRARCGDAPAARCEERVARARRVFLEAGVHPLRFETVPGSTPEEWGECGQLPEGFLPAYTYRPGMSAQYALALSDASDPALRFRFGLIASSDNHAARPGTGYKEYARETMSDAWGAGDEILARILPVERTPEPVPLGDLLTSGNPLLYLEPERNASFYYTGGLVAVHARGRDRGSIWEGLRGREVYGTSGDRILLWFDLLNAPSGPAPMGAEIRLDAAPRFRVRAVGAFAQLPGCPDHALGSLPPERLDRLCRGECYHPSDTRRVIERIEVVRIRPRVAPEEVVADLIEDPWRSFDCPYDPNGCAVEFEDPEFAERETVYYVRAIQEPTPAVNGDPLRCERDAAGRCVRSRPCHASGPRNADDDCLAPVGERAWSSPIFLTPGQ